MVVTRHVGAGNRTQVLCKQQVLSTEPSPEPPRPQHPTPGSPSLISVASSNTPLSVSHDLRRSFFEMGSRVFTSVPALQHCPDQGKVGEVKNTKKKKSQSLCSATCFHDNPASQRRTVERRASLPVHLLPGSAHASSTVPRSEVRFRGEALALSLLPPPLRSSRSPARHRLPPLIPRPNAQPRSSLSRGPPPCVTSGTNTSGLRLTPVLFSVPGAGGSGGPCGPVLWRRSLSWRAAAGECGAGMRAGPCARCHGPGPRLRPRGHGCSRRLVAERALE